MKRILLFLGIIFLLSHVVHAQTVDSLWNGYLSPFVQTGGTAPNFTVQGQFVSNGGFTGAQISLPLKPRLIVYSSNKCYELPFTAFSGTGSIIAGTVTDPSGTLSAIPSGSAIIFQPSSVYRVGPFPTGISASLQGCLQTYNNLKIDSIQTGGVTPGDKQDIDVVSSNVWVIDTGAVTTIKIAANAVDSNKIATLALPITRLARSGAANNQVMTWNTTLNSWIPADLGGVTSINGETGDVTDYLKTTDPVGSVGGDVTGTIDEMIVIGIQGQPLTGDNPTTGQVLKWNGTSWDPAADAGGTSITDFTAVAGAAPGVAASSHDGETYRNDVTGELWASNGSVWYAFNFGPKECLDTVLVSAITVQSGGSVTTGSPLLKNTSGVWEHMYNHPSGLNLIPDGVITDVIVGPRAIIQYCGIRKGSGATPNTSYYVNQSTNSGFTTTKPTTNIRPLGKVASNGDFLVNAGLLFSRDIGIKLDSVYYVNPTSSYCKEYFVQEYERKDSNLLILVLGDSKTEETHKGTQQLSRKLVLSRGTSYGGPGFGSFASTPAQGNWFAQSGVTIISGGVAEKSLNNKGLRLNTVGSYYEIFTSDPPWGNWKKITYTIQQEAAASSLTVTLDGVPSTVNIPSGSGLSTFSITAAANTTHTIRFTQLSGTTVLLNYYLTSELPNSTSAWNIGNSGSGANRWTNDILDNDWDILKPYDPDMIIIRLGINDAFGGLGATQFDTDMKSLLQKIKLKFPLTNITLVGTEQTLLGPSTYIEYNNVMATISQDSCYSFVDMDKVWSDWAKATSIGLTADDIHENTAGGEFVGKAYFEALMGRSDISVSSSSINYWKKVGSNVVRETGNVGIGLTNAVEKVDIFGTDSSYIKLNTGVSGSFVNPVYNGIKFFGGNPNFQLGRIEAVNEISNRASADIRFVLRNSLGTYTEAGRFSGLTGGLSLNTSALEALLEGKGKGNTTSTRTLSLRNSDNNSLISVLDATGKAGLGILNPEYNWDIYGSNPIMALRSNVFADNKKINFMTGSSVEGYIGLSSVTLTLSSGRGAGWGSNMVLETDGSTRMNISSTGAVTINSLAGTGNRIVQTNSTGVVQPTTIDPAIIYSITGAAGTVLTSTGVGIAPTWTTNSSESTKVGAFSNTATNQGLVMSGDSIKMTAADLTHPGGVNTTAQVFSAGTAQKTISADNGIQLRMDDPLATKSAGFQLSESGGTNIMVQVTGTSPDADNGNLVVKVEKAGSLETYIEAGALNDKDGIYQRGGQYEDIKSVTATTYTVLYGDRNLHLDATDMVVTLQTIGIGAGETKPGRVLYFFNDNSTSVTINGGGGQDIIDTNSLSLSANTAVTLIASGSKWIVKG